MAPASLGQSLAGFSGWDRRWLLAWLVALLACAVLLIGTAFLTPVSTDAGAYLTVAQSILEGRLPYRDLFDHKGPGIYYLFAAVLHLSGHSLAAVQVVQLSALFVTALLVGWTTHRWYGRRAGALAVLLLLYGGAAYAGAHLTTETWVALTMAALLAWLSRPRRQAIDWLVVGLLAGVGSLFKQTGLLTLLALGFWLLVLPSSRPRLSARWLGLAVGFVLPWALVAAGFALQDALGPFWQDVVVVNLTNYPPQRLSVLLRGNLVNLRAFPLLWLALLPALFLRPSVSQGAMADRKRILVWLVLLSGLAPLAHHSYGHYLLQALPPAAILGGAGLSAGWVWLGRRSGSWAQGCALALVLAIGLIDLPAWPPYLAYTQTLVARQTQAASHIEANTVPGQAILAITAAPQFYFLSHRSPASGWLYLYPVNYRPDREQELIDLVNSRAVPVVMVDDRDALPWHGRLKEAVEAACLPDQSFGPDLHVFRCF